MERRLAAILAADVVGYSRLIREDEAGTLAALKAHREQLIEPKVAARNGRIVKLMGDGVLAEFPSAVEAVQCAVEIQHTIGERNAAVPEEKRITYRVGINIGDIVVEDDDIYGDGVNVAARLEGLAEPSGICVARHVFDQVKDKLDLTIEHLGDRDVKNIAEPVTVYRVVLDDKAAKLVTPVVRRADKPERPSWMELPRWIAAALAVIVLLLAAGGAFWWKPWAPDVERAAIERMAYPLPDKPSIAVLPFINMSGDVEQEYFADGMTEDLITDLSKLSGLFVIARNSSFSYKGRQVKVRQVAEELGVRYVLEGSVRRVEDQIRVNAQLVDATTGGHLWADQYDDHVDNVFALQDRITKKIFAALALKLSAGEEEILGRKETSNIEAYDAFLKGWEFYRRWTPDDFQEALPYFQKAIELDPQYGRAYAAIASIYTESYQNAWDWSHVVGVSAEAMPGLAGEYLKEALKYPTPLAHQVASKWYIILLFSEESIAEAARAIALDPNDSVGYAAMATALIYAGRPKEAKDFVNKAIRFDPHSRTHYLFTLALAYFGMDQFQQAVSIFERAFKLNPRLGLVQRAYLTAAYVHLGEEKKALIEINKREIKDVRELYDLYVKYEGAYYKNPEDSSRLINPLQTLEHVAVK
jgi:TolB-like protein/class 3 adenylate cyclase/Flp pilus assembly protein TadD